MKALVIDGYNAIYKIPRLRKMLDKSLASAREELTDLAKEYKRKIGGIEKVCIVFDGKDRYRGRELPGGSPHIFSKTGKGDEEVINTIRSLRKVYAVLVVTDDNYIRNNARAYKARTIRVSAFLETLNRKRTDRFDGSGERKVDPLKAQKINRELKKYWNID